MVDLTEREICVEWDWIQDETILENTFENPVLSNIRDWAIQKIELLHEADCHRNADALLAEFDEWINIPDDLDEMEYISFE